jgi:3-deoxy-D-manno-octulosonate 8-phosphate phosphatase (KDO 8-P phosphatase)
MAKPLNEKLRLKEYAEKFSEKLKKIKVCAFDIDGILTDGGITWAGENVGFNRLRL